MIAINVNKEAQYELTYIPVNWTCPKCKKDNSVTFVLEENLFDSQDNIVTCIECTSKITILSSDIFNVK